MELFRHQRKALEWARDKDHFACFMEMRTGKSLVATNQVARWGNGPTLLIAPISTWFDWEHLLASLAIPTITLSGPTKQKQSTLLEHGDSAQWVITNPEGVSRWGKDFFKLTDGMFENCILDESVFIKNPKAKITKFLLKYKAMYLHRMVMTGTPIAEATEDVVTQMIWCNGHFMGKDNFYKWRMSFMKPAAFGWELKKGVDKRIREELKACSFVLSAKDAGMFTDQVRETVLVELPKRMMSDYRYLERHWKLDKASTKYGVVKSSWLSQLSCGIYAKAFDKDSDCFKSQIVVDICDGELEGQQVIVFSRWTKEVLALANALGCPYVTGSTPYDERKQLIDAFRAGEYEHIVFQTKTACRGIDLSCTDNAIMCSNYWEHEKRKQIMARMNHPNRKVTSLFIDIITKDTIEERVYEVLNEKQINASYFLQRLKAKVK